MTQYHSTLCGCIYDVDASYDYVSQTIDIEAVVTSHICDKHLPEKNNRKDVRILELLEQNRQLKAKCKRLDEYDNLVDENAQLLEALEEALNFVGQFDYWMGKESTTSKKIKQALAAAKYE